MGVYLRTEWPEWQPGVNTVAYYPLNTDLNDASGNNRNLTQKSGKTIITTLNGVECAYVNHSSVLYTDNSTILSYTGRTVNIRIYIANDSQTWWGGMGRGGNSYGDYNRSGIGWVYNGGFTVSDYVSNFSVNGISKNTWYNIVLAQSGTELKIYVNGSLVNTETVDITGEGAEAKCIALGCNTSYNFDGNGSQAYYSEVIFESKQRTATEVLNYYNSIKSNYGL